MNQPQYANASILLTRDNFGCGSSREHAPWALLDYGIRAILAPSFAEIFYNNCFQNSILPIVLEAQDIQRLFDHVSADDRFELTIDLAAQTISTPQQSTLRFSIDPFRKQCLLQGLDAIGLTLRREKDIADYEARRKQDAPWALSGLVLVGPLFRTSPASFDEPSRVSRILPDRGHGRERIIMSFHSSVSRRHHDG